MVGQILVVDDDPLCRALVTDALGAAGFDTHEVETADEALEFAADEAPALVVLDVNLPLISGYEVCRRLRDRYGSGLPIVFLSGERTESSSA